MFSYPAEQSAYKENPGIRRLGLFISSEKGGSDRAKLKYTYSDTVKLSRVIKELGGLDPADYRLLRNPDRNELFAAFNQFKRTITDVQAGLQQPAAKTEFFLYYSGHSDEQGLLLDTEKVSYLELRNFINSLPADAVILILDSCASGAITRLKGGTLASPLAIDRSQDTRGKAIITACSADEVAQESDNLQASFFTYYLISGLRGAADINQDKKVTLNEVYQFAYDETLRRTENTLGGPMHPSYHFSLYGRGDLLLTDINTTDSGVILNESLAGRVYIRDMQGKLLIEFNKLPGKEVTVAIPAGDYSISLYQHSKTMQCHISVGKQADTGGNLQPDFILIVKDKEQINFKGPVKVLTPEVKTGPLYFTSLGMGGGLLIPVNDSMREYFDIGYMPLLTCHINYSLPWGLVSIGVTTGTGINDMKAEISNGCLFYFLPLGLDLQYKTLFFQPFYLFAGVSGGLTFNFFVYREVADKQDDFRITSFLSPALGFGLEPWSGLEITLFSRLLSILFQDRQCLYFSPGVQLAYCFK